MIILSLLACSKDPKPTESLDSQPIRNLLNNPESVVYNHQQNCYLVSNWGDGTIVKIDSDSSQSYFNQELVNEYRLAGIYLNNDTLLVAAGDTTNAGVFGFNILTGEKLFHIVLENIGLPNDITMDRNGIIYVTDYWGDRLYKIENNNPEILIDQGGGLNYPNGIVYDEPHHRLLINSILGTGTPILEYDITNHVLSTVVSTGLYYIDGIVKDNQGYYYISDWGSDKIYRYDNNFMNPPEVFSEGHNDPADIYYNGSDDSIVIPNFDNNTIDIIQID